ncbi:hypothetical protein KUA23_27880 [Pseudomonas pergaminensis]|uniref:Uncharacterized protein n=1 Tax=Pseudomonas pergaminensis TaxID=2853159 RepID=A0ABD7TGL6_9PSED|nr:hypothetical protein [Pseudomonas pergaminensis]USW00777.1 hypothetical protein KUA23_27880 [Pseudomonas pergaminensis]
MTTFQRPFAVGQVPQLINPRQFPSPPFFTSRQVADLKSNTTISLMIPNHNSLRVGDLIEIYIDRTPTTTPSQTPYRVVPVDIISGTNTIARNTNFEITAQDSRRMLDQVFEMSCAAGTPGNPHIFYLSCFFGVTFINP